MFINIIWQYATVAKIYKDSQEVKLEINKQEIDQLSSTSDPGELSMGLFGTDGLLQNISMDIIEAFEKYILMKATKLEQTDKGNGVLLTMPSSAQSTPDWNLINFKAL
jgi:hypothetical protein